MTTLKIGENTYDCNPDETVLDALLRQDVEVPHVCKKGTCHSCMLQCTEGEPSKKSQADLKETLQSQNYFLSCLCIPKESMSLKLPDQSELFSEGKVIVKEMLNRNTLLLMIECLDILKFNAGQFVNLQREDGLVRSYSIANTPQDSKILEFHIRRLPNGQFSKWVHDELSEGDRLSVSEPKGHCFYISDRKQQDMLLIGTGTGLAPLLGIIKDALSQGHLGAISLFHGSSEKEDLYLVDEMQRLSKQHSNFSYVPCVSTGVVPEGFKKGRANEIALNEITELQGYRVFLCGHPDMVSQTKTQVFLKGASMADIYTDAFHISVA